MKTFVDFLNQAVRVNVENVLMQELTQLGHSVLCGAKGYTKTFIKHSLIVQNVVSSYRGQDILTKTDAILKNNAKFHKMGMHATVTSSTWDAATRQITYTIYIYNYKSPIWKGVIRTNPCKTAIQCMDTFGMDTDLVDKTYEVRLNKKPSYCRVIGVIGARKGFHVLVAYKPIGSEIWKTGMFRETIMGQLVKPVNI